MLGVPKPGPLMSIVTKTGDAGQTGLMFGRRVSKEDARLEACGTLDELSAALGMVRALPPDAGLQARLLQVQRDLITLMGEVATQTEDLEAFRKAGFHCLGTEQTTRLEEWIQALEQQLPPMSGWLLPGADPLSAALHLARTVCRRAERRVAALRTAGALVHSEPLIYLNRLGDLLWLWARAAEPASEPPSDRA
jgi:cob(I)alamin adenosyltransferase